MWNTPNTLTMARIVSIPVVIALYVSGFRTASLIILAAALLTDFFDGALARALKQETLFGAILDPVADKAVAICFWSFAGFYLHQAPMLLVYTYLARNTAQLLAIPILSWWLKKGFQVKPKTHPKVAGALCFALIPIYLFPEYGQGMSASLPMLAPYGGYMVAICVYLSILLEVYILFTYVPRLIAIATDRHDTFE